MPKQYSADFWAGGQVARNDAECPMLQISGDSFCCMTRVWPDCGGSKKLLPVRLSALRGLKKQCLIQVSTLTVSRSMDLGC